MTSWDKAVDFLVVGSGAAGMTGALRAADLGGEALVVEKASGDKCDRCWQVLADVGSASEHEALCHRCADAVRHSDVVAA